jgi:tRNA pseudouridine38-40 synthase
LELQPGKRTIRGEVEYALQKLFGHKIKVTTASRTDAGVHSLVQVFNFKLKSQMPTTKIAPALNTILPKEIRIIAVKGAANTFHARYDAKGKVYEYLVFNGRTLPPFLKPYVWQVKPKLDLSAMKKAAKFLVGKKDFSSFCAAHSDDKDFVRKISQVTIKTRDVVIWEGNKFPVISIIVNGNGFLYKMVRNMVGTLVEVGLGKIAPADVKKILKARDRKKAGRTAPAHGLCLVRINY